MGLLCSIGGAGFHLVSVSNSVLVSALDFACAVALQKLLAFELEADSGEGVAGKALYTVHCDCEQCSSLEALSSSSFLHGDSSDDTAGEGRQTGNDELAAYDGNSDEPGCSAHTGKTGKADNDGLPLLAQLLDGDDGTHVGDEQVDADSGAEGDQLSIGNDLCGDNSPVTDQQNASGNEDRGDPSLGQLGDYFTNEVGNTADDKCKCEIIH